MPQCYSTNSNVSSRIRIYLKMQLNRYKASMQDPENNKEYHFKLPPSTNDIPIHLAQSPSHFARFPFACAM